MKTYRVKVVQGEDGWLVAKVTNLRGAITQGRDLNELTFMVRDAIGCLTETQDFAVQLLVPPTIRVPVAKSAAAARKRSKNAA